MKNSEPSDDSWSLRLPGNDAGRSPGLKRADRAKRLAIALGKPGYIDDEVVVTLLLGSWRAGEDSDAATFAGALTGRVLKQVRAHIRKNPGWLLRGGGSTVAEDLCQSIILAILQDKAKPCHAEQAFGNFVYRRCLDEAGKLYAKSIARASHSMTRSQSRVGRRSVSPLTRPRCIFHRQSCWSGCKSSVARVFSLSRFDGSCRKNFRRSRACLYVSLLTVR